MGICVPAHWAILVRSQLLPRFGTWASYEMGPWTNIFKIWVGKKIPNMLPKVPGGPQALPKIIKSFWGWSRPATYKKPSCEVNLLICVRGYYGDDASIQPGNLQQVMLHETAVGWIRYRERAKRPATPWQETYAEFGTRLRGIAIH